MFVKKRVVQSAIQSLVKIASNKYVFVKKTCCSKCYLKSCKIASNKYVFVKKRVVHNAIQSLVKERLINMCL